MERSSTTLIIVMLIVGLGIGGGIGYYMAPVKEIPGETITEYVEVQPLDGKTVKIGDIQSQTANIANYEPLQQKIMQVDLNEMAKKLGYDVTFEFLLDDAQQQPAVHLEKVQSFKAMDINLVIGGRWSSQAQGALSYVNENNMLLFSPSSTSPLLAIPDDNLYRMCPTDLVQAPAIAEMLWSWGIKAIVVIQRGDSWADGIYNILEVDYPAKGGVILERFRYATEVTEFSTYLAEAEDVLKAAVDKYGKDHVAVEVISFAETATMLTQAKDFPTLWSVFWFGSDGTAMSSQIRGNAPEESAHLYLFSTLAAPASSSKYWDLYDRYYSYTSAPFTYYDACAYDIATTLMTAVLEAQSTDASDVIPLLQDITFNQFGASGWTRLNEDGDRYAGNYDIWGYTYTPGAAEAENVSFGLYDGMTGKVTWYTDVLGFSPPGQG